MAKELSKDEAEELEMEIREEKKRELAQEYADEQTSDDYSDYTDERLEEIEADVQANQECYADHDTVNLQVHEGTVIHRQVSDLTDSIETGTPSKGGAIKVYFNAAKVEDAKIRIENAVAMRKFMQEQIDFVEQSANSNSTSKADAQAVGSRSEK